MKNWPSNLRAEEKRSVAVLFPYWGFWESSLDAVEFRNEREAILSDVSEFLDKNNYRVIRFPFVDSPEVGNSIAGQLMKSEVDAVLILQTMAVPTSHILPVVESLPGVPILVWALQNSFSLDDDFSQAEITSLGATVGTPMLTNYLNRIGRTHRVIFGSYQENDFSELMEELEVAAIAGSLKGAKLARIGESIPGYFCVEAKSDEIENLLGLEVVDLTAEDFAASYQEVEEEQIDLLIKESSQYEVSEDLETFSQTIRAAGALENIDEKYGISMGAMNCHVDEIRFSKEIGIAPCFALGRETGRGVPWTCSGDVITAIAMYVARALGGAALYHEIEALDFDTGEFVIANSGEHDLSWCRESDVALLQANPWYEKDELTGGSIWFELPVGAATLVAFTPFHDEVSGYRFVVAEGNITGRSFSSSPTVGGSFRFSGDLPPSESWLNWVNAGVNHHSAIAPGHLAKKVKKVAKHLSIGFVEITERN